MQYSYVIEKVSAKQKFMRVRYFADGQPDIYKAFNPNLFDRTSLEQLAEGYAPAVIREWERIAGVTEPGDSAVGVGEVRVREEQAPPEPPEPTFEEKRSARSGEISRDRERREFASIEWTPQGATTPLVVPVDERSMARYTTALAAMSRATMQRPPITRLKVFDLNQVPFPERPILRQTTDEELEEIMELVEQHREDCAEAEERAMEKLYEQNDLAADFETEYTAITQGV